MTDTTTIAALRAAQRAAGREFADRLADLTGAALELVEIETTLRVAETRAGEPSRGPQARELAVDLLVWPPWLPEAAFAVRHDRIRQPRRRGADPMTTCDENAEPTSTACTPSPPVATTAWTIA